LPNALALANPLCREPLHLERLPQKKPLKKYVKQQQILVIVPMFLRGRWYQVKVE
jgi:predicted lipid carrier protein YhbT